LLARLTGDLADAESGVAFVYRSLAEVVAYTQATDAVVIIDEPGLGRQAFRVGRRPVTDSWARDLVRTGQRGLYTVPAGSASELAGGVTNLCALALRLDVARHESLHDPLTGLLNRRSFDAELSAACSSAERYGWPFGLVLIDVNGFKSVNDRLGHAAGDATLRAIGSELRRRLRLGDVAARIGGDEFALIVPKGDAGLLPSLTQRLEEAVQVAVPAAAVTVSLGLAVAPEDETDPTRLFLLADERLYRRKRT